MSIINKNNFFSPLEIQDVRERENNLFSNFSEKLNYIVSKSKGWRKILTGCKIDEINSRKDLEKLPITKKTSLIDLQKNNLPYAELNTKDCKDFPFMFASPGPIYEPGETGDFWNMASSMYAAGLRKGDLVYNTFSYHLGPAGLMMNNSANFLGCTVLPGGVGNTDLQVATIESLKPNFYLGTPSFLKILLEKIKEKNSEFSCFKNALVGAEAFPKDLREYFSNDYNISPLQMYGTAEVGCIAYETINENNKINEGMVIEENIIIEIVRPGTLEQVSMGEVGEVVVTKINSNYPMIRLATGDLSAIIKEESPCGRTNLRIKGWMGRAEQSTKLKGLFITPNQVGMVLKKFNDILKVRLVIDRKDLLDYAILYCEVKEEVSLDTEIVKSFFKQEFKLNIKVELVSKDTISNDGIVIEDKRNNN
tara:strand:+ start:399 stop:1664 length:1266 start_codon:yes stop_codon:yes gene_type:complete